MQNSISLQDDLAQQYLLRIGDTCLILGQRIAEWAGHAPILEEDIALSNMALDLIGQARAVLTLAGQSSGHDEDQLAFLREERHYYNPTLVELPRGDFALTVLRNTMASTLLVLLWGATVVRIPTLWRDQRQRSLWAGEVNQEFGVLEPLAQIALDLHARGMPQPSRSILPHCGTCRQIQCARQAAILRFGDGLDQHVPHAPGGAGNGNGVTSRVV